MNDSTYIDNFHDDNNDTGDSSSDTYEDTIEKLIMVIGNYKSEYEKSQQDCIFLAAQYEELNAEKELNENENHLYIEELEQALTTLDSNYNSKTYALTEKDAECLQLQLTLHAFQTLYEGTEESKSQQIEEYQKVLETNQKLIDEIKQYKLQIEADEERMNQQYALIVDLKCQIKETNQQLALLNHDNSNNTIYNPNNEVIKGNSIQNQNYLQSNTSLTSRSNDAENINSNIATVNNDIDHTFQNNTPSIDTLPTKTKSFTPHNAPPPTTMSIEDKDVYNLIQTIRQRHQQQYGGSMTKSKKIMNISNKTTTLNNDPMNNNSNTSINNNTSSNKSMPLKFCKPKSMIIDKNSDSWIFANNTNNTNNNNHHHRNNNNNNTTTNTHNNMTLTDFDEFSLTSKQHPISSLPIKQNSNRGYNNGNSNNNNNNNNNDNSLFSTNELTNVFGHTNDSSSNKTGKSSSAFFNYSSNSRETITTNNSTNTNNTTYNNNNNNNQRESILSTSGIIATKLISNRRNKLLGSSIGNFINSPRRNTIHPEPLQLPLHSNMSEVSQYPHQPQSRSVVAELRRATATAAVMASESTHTYQPPPSVQRHLRVTADSDSSYSDDSHSSDEECAPDTVSLKHSSDRRRHDDDEY